jgi:hypothetical protein
MFVCHLHISSHHCITYSSVGIATDYGAGWSRDRIPVGLRFSARPDRPWGPPSLLYNGYRVFPGGKVRPGPAADPSPPSGAEVELYLYPPLGHNWAGNGATLPFLTALHRNEVRTAYSEKEGCLHIASLILTSALNTGEWSHSHANHSALGTAPGTPKLGGSVGTRAGVDALDKRKISHP